jgi:hypothetical protein
VQPGRHRANVSVCSPCCCSAAQRIEIDEKAKKDLAALDKAQAKRITAFLRERVAGLDDPRSGGSADMESGNQSPSENTDRMATIIGNAVALTWQGDRITMSNMIPLARRVPCPPPLKSNPR